MFPWGEANVSAAASLTLLDCPRGRERGQEGGRESKVLPVSCPVLGGDSVGFVFFFVFYKNKDERTYLEKMLGNQEFRCLLTPGSCSAC